MNFGRLQIWLESFAQDVRYAARNLARAPGFTATAILSLGLGIGANSTIFSFVDGLLLRPLAVPRAEEIVRLHANAPDYRFGRFAYREYAALREGNRMLTGLAAELDGFFSVQAQPQEQARVAYGDFVSANYFATLGVQPELGRGFTAQDDASGAAAIPVVLSHRAWESRFHSDARVVGAPILVGSPIKLNGLPARVVGILPESFTGTLGAEPEIYVPLAAQPEMTRSGVELKDTTWAQLFLLGRLKPASSVKSAQAEFSVLADDLAKQYPDTNRRRTFAVLSDRMSRLQQQPENALSSIGLLVTAIMILGIACINVANLLLGRAGARAKEIAIRLAVGATRRRLIRQLLTESLVLAGLGAAAGLLFGAWGIRLLGSVQLPSDLVLPALARMDRRVVLYSLAAMLVSAIASGLAPAIRATQGAVAFRKQAGRNFTIGAQAALSALTLVVAVMFVKNFYLSAHASPGFRTENVLLLSFDPSLAGYSQERGEAFYRDLEDRVRAMPGVRAATLASHVPLGPSNSSRTLLRDAASFPNIVFNKIEPGFFDTMATSILFGRAIDDRDKAGSPRVMVVNETLAKRLWPQDSPSQTVGRRVRMYQANGPVVEIVGIARDAVYSFVGEPPSPYMYIPAAQDPQAQMTLFVYTAGDPASMAPAIRAQAQALAPELPVYDVRTMRSVFDAFGMMAVRVAAQTMGAMGMMGLVLSALGLYAVTGFIVSRRTKELGIRMALGATRGAIRKEVLTSALKFVVAGIAVGVAGAFATTNYFAALAVHVSPRDPSVFFGVTAVLLLVALGAAWVPAQRTARVDPVIALRED